MKKNIRDYKKVGVQYGYILDAIEHENNNAVLTDKEKVAYFFDCFYKEFNDYNNQSIYPNTQKRISEYLRGLPSCIGIEFSDYEISIIGKSWSYCKTDKQTAKFVDRWFDTIAYRLLKLKEYYNI